MTDTFEAALVRAGQLQKATRQDGSTSSYMYITVVRNYQKFNRQTQTWEEQGSIFQECSLNGKSAELFAQAGYDPGTLLLITGRKAFQPKQSFQSKQTGEMIERPESESIMVDSIGAIIGKWQMPILPKKNNNAQQQTYTQQAAQPAMGNQTQNTNNNDILNERPVNNNNSVKQDDLFDFDELE